MGGSMNTPLRKERKERKEYAINSFISFNSLVRSHASDACHYCGQPLIGDRMMFRVGSLLLRLHPVCTRQLSRDLEEQIDSYYSEKYFRGQGIVTLEITVDRLPCFPANCRYGGRNRLHLAV
jgi:hypothetical protein